MTQCENLRIFLIVRFYVKSILGMSEYEKVSFQPFWKLWILIFRKFKYWTIVKNSSFQNFEPIKLWKLQFLSNMRVRNFIFSQLQASKTWFWLIWSQISQTKNFNFSTFWLLKNIFLVLFFRFGSLHIHQDSFHVKSDQQKTS